MNWSKIIIDSFLQTIKESNLVTSGSYSIATLGSMSSREYDLLVFNNCPTHGNVLQKTVRFIEDLSSIHNLPDFQIIMRHEHHAFLPKDIKKLHLLYYPSRTHLFEFEPYSFLAYVFDRGHFICGDKQCFYDPSNVFRSQWYTYSQTANPRSIDSHINSVIMHYLYLHLNPSGLPLSFHFNGLIYALRFAITNMFVEKLQPEESISFWDWEELLSYIHNNYPNQATLVQLFSNKNSIFPGLSLNQLRLLSTECLNLFDVGITSFGKYEFAKNLFARETGSNNENIN